MYIKISTMATHVQFLKKKEKKRDNASLVLWLTSLTTKPTTGWRGMAYSKPWSVWFGLVWSRFVSLILLSGLVSMDFSLV